MKKMKKIFAIMITMVMVLAMALPVLAEQPTDKVQGRITGLGEGDTVRWGRILKLNDTKTAYVLDKLGDEIVAESSISEADIIDAFVGFDGKQPNSGKIREILNWLGNNKTGSSAYSGGQTTAGTGGIAYLNDLEAGIYAVKAEPCAATLAIPGNENLVYTPMMLVSAKLSYDENGNLNGIVKDGDTELEVKKTKETKTFDKMITDPTNDIIGEASKSEGINTYHVGDTVHYMIHMDAPWYDKETTNRTFYIYDTLPKGVTYKKGSLKFAIVNKGADAPSESMYDVVKPSTGITEFGSADYAILDESGTDGTSYALYFNYDLCKFNGFKKDDNGKDTSEPQEKEVYVIYEGVVNEEALVGQAGNINKAVEITPTDPNMGGTSLPITHPKTPSGDATNPTKGFDKKEDEEIVYTYGFYIVKRASSSDGKDGATLKGATFQVFTDEAGETPLKLNGKDVTFTTNSEGIGGVAGLKKGTYYVKEIAAPAGYSLLTGTTRIDVSYALSKKITKTTTISSWVGPDVKIEYTADKAEALSQEQAKNEAGQLLYLTEDNKVVTYETEWPAYEKSRTPQPITYGKPDETTTVTKDTIYFDSKQTGKEVPSYLIINTKLGELPSTGGTGTIIFSVVGSLGMLAAVAIFFANRRRVRK